MPTAQKMLERFVRHAIKKEKTMKKQIILMGVMLSLGLFLSSPTQAIDSPSLNKDDTKTTVRTPITHGFWWPKTVAIGEEWYRGRLIQQDGHDETGELPDFSDGHAGSDGHLGFTAINSTRWNITHHWFGGDDDLAEAQLYTPNPAWFFDSSNPANSVMGVFALFRWGFLNEIEARLAVHDMIKSYRTGREYTILADGIWLGAMANLSTGDFTDNDGAPREVPDPLGLGDAQAIRNEISVIITHHFFGRNDDNTVQVMDEIFEDLIEVLVQFNNGGLSEEQARQEITELVNEDSDDDD